MGKSLSLHTNWRKSSKIVLCGRWISRAAVRMLKTHARLGPLSSIRSSYRSCAFAASPAPWEKSSTRRGECCRSSLREEKLNSDFSGRSMRKTRRTIFGETLTGKKPTSMALSAEASTVCRDKHCILIAKIVKVLNLPQECRPLHEVPKNDLLIP